MLCNVGDGDDNDYESSINNAEEGDSDKGNGVSKQVYFTITNKSNIYNIYKYKFIKIENCGNGALCDVWWQG